MLYVFYRRRTRVIVRCEECGRQRLELEQLAVRQCMSTGDYDATWRCGKCSALATTPLTYELATRLRLAGVRCELWDSVPVGAGVVRDDAMLTLDDLLEWHELLAQPGWVESALAELDPPD